ncbi:UGP2 [Lepeophtheirus salmonis]|uniref:UTP--glucose-1-phosphate uridylyltransferase n=1 Tax=Lepeophtheirus salmonis TaxID=72036 RepID=A0A7R8HE99_LEPSM|nr:UGP2 [Lepeophtheirus salmonis]CAF3040799.1 UGP2 [Lepeophtheirus salmonis]
MEHELDNLLTGKLFKKFMLSEGTSIKWEKIEKLPTDAIRKREALPEPEDKKKNNSVDAQKACRPKSVISVRNDLTFLDLTVQQIEYLNKTYDVDVPLILMNSFNTDKDTHKLVKKYAGINVKILTFNQSRYPRIHKESHMPIASDIRTESFMEAWYPPGHGDFYRSFSNSGLMDKLIDDGKEFCFLSNIDNMGATVDLGILNLCLNENREFVMEVTDKTRADVKGGTLIKYEGKLRLLEVAQVPKAHTEDFKSVKKFNVFNTNSLWMSLPAIKRVVSTNSLDMDVIVNPKVMDGGLNVIQLETAVGAAMKCFENAIGINVPRSRFLPVKKCSDLLLIMSNLYTMSNGSLVMSPERMFATTPLIKLGDNNFKQVAEFNQRFASIPDILELDHLTVSGNVNFGKGVSLRGTVIIIANHGERIDIPDGSILENKIVSANLNDLKYLYTRKSAEFNMILPRSSSSLLRKVLWNPKGWRNITQHRVVLVPQIPKDTHETNPILRTKGLTDYSVVTERDCYFGLGKALLQFESTVAQVESICREGEKDFYKDYSSIGKLQRIYLQSCIKELKRHFNKDLIRWISTIHLKASIMKKYGLNEELSQILDRYLLECKFQGLDLSPKKYIDFRETFIPNLTTNLGDYNYKMQRSTSRFRHTIVDPNLVHEYPVDVLRAISTDSSQPAKGPWTITLHPYVYRKFMEYCPDRRLRWNAYLANVNRGSKDFDVYLAAIKTINVETMVNCLLPSAKVSQEKELESLQYFAESTGFEEDLATYDVEFFKRKQRKSVLGMTDDDIRDYFPLPQLVDNNELINKRGFNPWNKDVQFYRVFDSDGTSVLGEFYFDPYIRDDKIYTGSDKGFYFPLKNKSNDGCSLGSMVMSLPIPAYGKPSLLNFFEVEEVFRTTGKLLAHILNKHKLSDLSSQYVEEDCYDVISEYMTHWLYKPEVLKSLCQHWSSRDKADEKLINCLINTRKHMAGLELCEELFKSSFDITLYKEDPMQESYMDILDRLYPEYLLIPREKEDNFPLYFEDIITRKHPGSYYGKLEIPDVTMRFREFFLSNGNFLPYAEKFRRYRGRDPSHEALLFSLGLKESQAPKFKSKSIEVMET